MKIIIKNFQKKIPINPTRIKKTILKVLSSQRPVRSGEITVSFVNEGKIKELNKMYLGKDSTTDVLAFEISADKKACWLLADIVICTDTAMYNSKLYDTTPLYESYLYIIHGVLHLLGYNDKTLRQRALMRKKEKEFLLAPFFERTYVNT